MTSVLVILGIVVILVTLGLPRHPNENKKGRQGRNRDMGAGDSGPGWFSDDDD